MFDQLKPLIQNGERIIAVEGGKPEYVLLRFSDYAALAGLGGKVGNPRPASSGDLERANTELAAGAAGEAELLSAPAPAHDPATIRLEDLPL